MACPPWMALTQNCTPFSAYPAGRDGRDGECSDCSAHWLNESHRLIHALQWISQFSLHLCVGFLYFCCALPSASPPPPPPPCLLSLTRSSFIHTFVTHNSFKHTHTQLFHAQYSHTQLFYTQLFHTQVWRSFWWQKWRLVTLTLLLCGRCGTYGAGLALVVCLVWLLTRAALRGRRGIWSHSRGFCMGVASSTGPASFLLPCQRHLPGTLADGSMLFDMHTSGSTDGAEVSFLDTLCTWLSHKLSQHTVWLALVFVSHCLPWSQKILLALPCCQVPIRLHSAVFWRDMQRSTCIRWAPVALFMAPNQRLPITKSHGVGTVFGYKSAALCHATLSHATPSHAGRLRLLSHTTPSHATRSHACTSLSHTTLLHESLPRTPLSQTAMISHTTPQHITHLCHTHAHTHTHPLYTTLSHQTFFIANSFTYNSVTHNSGAHTQTHTSSPGNSSTYTTLSHTRTHAHTHTPLSDTPSLSHAALPPTALSHSALSHTTL